MVSVDLNSDLGEGFGAYSCGDDEAMLGIVTSANVACGLHAGDPEIMAKAFAVARERGVAIGAHPGFPDLWGFGRRRIPFSTGEIERLVAYQVGAAQALAAYAGHRVTYVKPHGALGNVSCEERPVADAIARAVKAVDPSLALLATALTEQVAAGEAAGLTTYQEIFADRGYTDEGLLIARSKPGAMITDHEEAAARVLEMVTEGVIVTATGKRLPTPIRSICVHGDSSHAVAMARHVRKALEQAGIKLAAICMSSADIKPRFRDAGEAALVVEFGSDVDPAISERVLALDAAMADASPAGLRELVPTYRSLMIHYDPLTIPRETLVALVEERLAAPATRARPATFWTVPCCYEAPQAEDLAEMAAVMGMSAERAAQIHASATYRAYMCGFAPGFTYLGGLPEAIAVSRRAKPRPPHDSKVVLVGGGLCAIATFPMPTGWYVVGRTPERLYAPDRPHAFLMEPGDLIRFEPIDAATFASLDGRAEAGEVVARRQAQ